MRTAVVSGCDPSPILEPAEHAFDQIALLVEFCVVGDRHLTVLAPRNARCDVEIGQGLAEPVTIISYSLSAISTSVSGGRWGSTASALS
jgi:hypothetical protein